MLCEVAVATLFALYGVFGSSIVITVSIFFSYLVFVKYSCLKFLLAIFKLIFLFPGWLLDFSFDLIRSSTLHTLSNQHEDLIGIIRGASRKEIRTYFKALLNLVIMTLSFSWKLTSTPIELRLFLNL